MKKILVVDDSDSMIDLLRIVLKDEGYEVLTCEDGEAGYHVAREQRPDLLIVDLRMPKVDGWALIDTVRRNPSLRHLPVVVCTAERELLQARLECLPKACTIFEKPFELDRLLAAVRTLLDHPTPVAVAQPVGSRTPSLPPSAASLDDGLPLS